MMRKGVTALQNVRLTQMVCRRPASSRCGICSGDSRVNHPTNTNRMASLVPSLGASPSARVQGAGDRALQPLLRTAGGVRAARSWARAFITNCSIRRQAVRSPISPTPSIIGISMAATRRPMSEDFVPRWNAGRRFTTWPSARCPIVGGPDFVLVEDRRPGLESADYLFEGLEAQIFLGCVGPGPPRVNSAAWLTTGRPRRDVTEIETFLDDWWARSLYIAKAIAFSTSQLRQFLEGHPPMFHACRALALVLGFALAIATAVSAQLPKNPQDRSAILPGCWVMRSNVS